MRKVFALIGILCISFHTNACKPAKKTPALFSLCIARYDHVNKIASHEILVLAKIDSGKYYQVDEKYPDDSVNIHNSIRAQLMSQVPKFNVFKQGNLVNSLKILSFEKADFHCSALIVGKASSEKLVDTSNPSSRWGGFEDGRDIDFSIGYLASFNSETSQPESSKPIRVVGTQDDSIQVKKIALHEFQSKVPKIKSDLIQLNGLAVYDINRNASYIFTAHSSTTDRIESVGGVYQIINGKIVPLLRLNQTNESDSWGRGYEFLDALDLDGDSVPELVFEVGYYEATGFEIYKLVNGRFEKVFETIAWGC
jgi:hypothetical protein